MPLPQLRPRHTRGFTTVAMRQRWDSSLLLAAIFLPCVTYAYSACPNGCSGHGACALPTSTGSTGAGTLATTVGLCTCDGGYTLPDCSGRTCPTGRSIFDAATADGIAHQTGIECSNAGVCSTVTGTCECVSGYTGDACQRQDCENGDDNQCNGHGTCRTMHYLAEHYGPPATTASKLAVGPIYANWESQLYRGCFCDWGWTGNDCTNKLCPKGDDARTTGQANVIFTITTSGTSGTALAGYFTFHFYGHTTQFKADAYSPTFSNANCVTFVQALPNVETATCVVSSISSDHRGATYTITVTKYAVTPYENNFFYHEGNPLASYMGCSIDDLTAGASPVCAVAVTQQSTKEYLYCSNRGICDMDSGTCSCDLNFYGRNCENEGSIVQVDDASTALQLTAESSTYVGTLLEMKVATTATANYKFINMIANGASKFSINGVGEVTLSGITVDTTGVTATDGGASITQATNSDVFTATASQTSFTETIFVMASSKAADSDFNAMLFKAGNGGTEVFKVTGDGAITTTNAVQSTSPTTGSIKTAGGVAVGKAVYVGGIIVTASLTDSTSTTTGSIITAGGMGIAKRLTSAQLEVANSEQLSPTTAAAYFRNSHLSFAGNVLLIESSMQAGASSFNLIQANINKDLTKVLKFEVDGSGYVTAAGGANVLAGGVTVAAGGATVAAGGLTISAGSIALTSTAAQTITHTGSANNGLTISSGGGVTLSGAVIFGASGCNCASSGGLDLKNAVPMRFDGATEDNYWLNIAVGAGPTGSSKTLTLPVGETGTLLTDATTGSSVLTSVGTLTGLAVTGTTTLSTTTGVTHITNSRTSGFVGNLLQLDTAMETASNAYNIILARVDTAGTPTTKFKVDGTGKVTAAGGAVFGGTGMSLAAGDFTMTSSGAAAITHTGSGSNGLTISSGGGVTISGAVTFGSTTYGVTIGNNQPIQFDGDTVDSNYLILDVGNGPTGGSKTLTLPIDSTATVVASASTLAVTIQTSHADGVTVESAKHVDNAITETSGSTFLSLEGVRFEDGAVSTVTTVGMTSHLTNSGGDVLLTKGSGQAITKSGGGDLIITNSVANDFVHVEDWTFKAGDITSSSHLSIDAASSTLEKFKCTENVCEHSAGDGASNFISIEVVRFYNGAISAATTIDMSSHLTNSGGDVLLTKGSGQAITKSGGGDLVITNSVANDYVQVEDLKFKAGAVESTAHLTIEGASVTIENFKCTAKVCEHSAGGGGSNFISIEVVQFLDGAMSATTDFTMSGDLTNAGGDVLLTKGSGQAITKSGGGDLVISGSAAVCVEDFCVTAGVAASSSVHLQIEGASVALEKFKCIDGDCDSSVSSFLSIEVAKMQDEAMSAVVDLTLSPYTSHFGSYYTITQVRNAMTESAGVFVTQGSNRGVLVNSVAGSAVTTYTIFGSSGLTWATGTDIVVGSTTPAKTLYTVVFSVPQTFTEAAGVAVTQGSLSGTLYHHIGNLYPATSLVIYANTGLSWSTSTAITLNSGTTVVNNVIYTVAITGQTITATAGVAIVQSSRSGTLYESLSGTVSSFKILAAAGLTWATVADISIDGSPILSGTINTVAASTFAFSSITASDVVSLVGVTSAESAGHMYTIHLSTATSFSKAAGVAVTQGSLKGILKTAISGSVLFFDVHANVGLEWSTSADIDLGGTTVSSGIISSIVVLGSLQTTGGDLLFTHSSGDQDITKSVNGNLIISGPSAVKVESWEFTAAAVTDLATADLSMDGASAGLEKLKCVSKDCYHVAGDGNSNYMLLELVQFYNGGLSDVTTVTMDSHITNSGGDVLLTKSTNQLITNSNTGDLTITNTGLGAIEVSNWKTTNGAVASPSSHLSIDANTVRIENLMCVGSTFFNADNSNALGGSTAITLEDVTILNAAQSGKSVTLDANDNDPANAIVITNTATQSSGTLMSITGTQTSNLAILAVKHVAGTVEIGSNPLKVELSEDGITRMAVEVTTKNFGVGYQSWTFTLGADHGLTKAVGVTVSQGGMSGKLQTALTGSGTSIVVTALADQIFVQDVVLVVDSASVNNIIYTVTITAQTISKSANDAISQSSRSGKLLASLSGSVTEFKIIAASGLTWDTGADITIDGTAIAHASIVSVTATTLKYDVGHQIGTYTLLSDHGLTKPVNSAVSQGTKVSGILKTALGGSGTSVVVEVPNGQLLYTIVDLVVGGTTILNQFIDSVSTTHRDSESWDTKYTMTITATNINEGAGVQVKQGVNVGALYTTLGGSSDSVVIMGAQGITWATTGIDLVVGGTTLAPALLQSVANNGQQGGALTMNSAAGTFTYHGCTVAAGSCSAEHTFNNNKILSANSVVMMVTAGFESQNRGGMTPYSNPSKGGIPILSTGNVGTGSVPFFICNMGSAEIISGDLKINYIIYSA